MNLGDILDKVRWIESTESPEVLMIMGERMSGRTTALSRIVEVASYGGIEYVYVGATEASARVGGRMAGVHSNRDRRFVSARNLHNRPHHGQRPRVLLLDDWNVYGNEDRMGITEYWAIERPRITVVATGIVVASQSVPLAYSAARFTNWNAGTDEDPEIHYEVEPVVGVVKL